MRRHRKTRGFTLIELMVVMVILVLLAGVASVVVINRIEDGKRAKAIADINAFEQALDAYKVDVGDYPTTEQGLAALRERPSDVTNWNGPYLKKAIPTDPWGNPYHYESPGTHNTEGVDIWSYGKDGKEGGEGNNADITNWQEE
ncbi:MAG: type II secretion system major pseudopilin GspG [Abditibacteriales bacterium]|nr:type II secretion system major pseudopilin GspG [Abditibacteriales bacterium]MDW8365596.1 type II secretion system major pseudopilin GspG [Abditibacteriales bacterium]